MKSKRIDIGPGVAIDLDKLMTSRLLLQATSGAGKSWLLRRLLEQSHGLCQQIIIDPEGEFSTLREQFDYVLAAKSGGDTLADVRTAKLLAERLLELGVSAIIDIYELNPDQRVKFVRLFLEALVDAPKHLWHPVLVVLDEAHAFAPEKGSGEAESATAVKALCTRGRKRGFCAVLATQRLPTLSKDAAAMCANKLIGRASLDTDMARAGAELGFSKPESVVLRDLDDGEFYAFGPAITKTVTKVKVGPVQTTHPQAGSQLAARVPPPTAKVKALLPQLSDLPAEAEDRERSMAELRTDVAKLKHELALAKKAAPATVTLPAKTVAVLTDADRELLEKVYQKLNERFAAVQRTFNLDTVRTAAKDAIDERIDHLLMEQASERDEFIAIVLGKRFEKLVAKLPEPESAPRRPDGAHGYAHGGVHPNNLSSGPSVPTANERQVERAAAAPPADGLDGAQQKILDTVLMLRLRGIPAERVSVARWMGIHPKGGRYGSNVGFLRANGYLEEKGWELSAGGEKAARLTVKLGRAGAREALEDDAQRSIFDTIDNAGKGARFTRETLAEALGIHPKGGRYGSNLGHMRAMGLIPAKGDIYLTEATYR